MELQSAACCFLLQSSVSLSNKASISASYSPASGANRNRRKVPWRSNDWKNATVGLSLCLRWNGQPGFLFVNSSKKDIIFSASNSAVETIPNGSTSDKDAVSNSPGKITSSAASDRNVFFSKESFHGKSGVISFCGLTHELLEERKLVSSPFKDETGSLFWIVGPIALISSLVVPQFFLNDAIDKILKDVILAEILGSISSDFMVYIGFATFLFVTDRVQRPYLEFSSKRWALITGLQGYLYSTFLTMGLKVLAPLFAVFVVWPVLGLPALVAVAPFLVGCGVQVLFEAKLEKRKSSCWPLVPIIFEVYRLYQLTKAANFVQMLMLEMKGMPRSPDLLERSTALVSMVAVLQALALVCLWSLLTFLIRLFPSRPVAERY